MSTRHKKTPATSELIGLIGLRSIAVHPLTEKTRLTLVADDPKLREIDFTAVRPIRRIKSYQGQRHKPVFAYVEACQDHITCESRLEARVLMEMDFDGLIAAVASQPFTLRYTEGGCEYRHTPDFAVADAHGQVSIVDVKPFEVQGMQKNLRDFQATAQWCERMEFEYRVTAGYGEPLASTIRFLARSRRKPPGWHEQAPVVLRSLDSHGEQVSFEELVNRSAAVLDLPKPLVMPTVFCLMWHGFLLWDTSQELQPNLLLHMSQILTWSEVSS